MDAPRILVVYATCEGHTAAVAERVAAGLRAGGAQVDCEPAERAPGPAGYDAVVTGDPIHAGRHHPAMVDYLSHHGPALGGRALGLFQVSLTSASADADHAERARALLAGLVDRFGLRPDVVATFAGALRYSRYGWLKRRLMRSIARREGGDTDTSHDHVYTDWDAVDRFAVDVRRVTDEVAGRVPAGRLCPIGPG